MAKPIAAMAARSATLLTTVLKPALGFLALILVWQYGVPLARIPQYVLPLPSTIALR